MTLSIDLSMAITKGEAALFAPFVLPVCVWAAYSDLSRMKIPNRSVLVLALIFVLLGLFVLPLPDYGFRLVHLVVVLVIGILANAAGLLGAGDAKFAAAAAPFIALGDLNLLLWLFMANVVAGIATHRAVKYSALSRLAPEWESWKRHGKFPMGLCLGGTLAIYLLLGIYYGA
ncbi:MAG: prepilin peptidase [Paracoccaceae bacterium]